MLTEHVFPETLNRGEYGVLLCPLDHVETRIVTLNDPTDPVPGGEHLPPGPPWAEEWQSTRSACGEELHVVYEATAWASSFDEPGPHDLSAGKWANCDSWRVECSNGHVLARSSGEESAEPFHPSVLRGWTPDPEAAG